VEKANLVALLIVLSLPMTPIPREMLKFQKVPVKRS